MKIKLERISHKVTLPQKMTTESSGFDLYSFEDKILPASKIMNKNKIEIGHTHIKTGIKLEIPNGYVGRIGSRSGLSIHDNIEVGAGWIDSDYRGEVLVELKNLSSKHFKIKLGDRIAQLFLIKIGNCEFKEVNNLSKTNRAEQGFGSTNR